MDHAEQIKSVLQDLFASQKLAVLATHDDDGQPYVSLMAFAATEDLKQLLFATDRNTRKYANLRADPRAAMLIDSRSNRDADLQQAIAVTATGTAEEVEGSEREYLLGLYLVKHPHMEEFATSPSCALVRMKVTCYYLVSKFQETHGIDPQRI